MGDCTSRKTSYTEFIPANVGESLKSGRVEGEAESAVPASEPGVAVADQLRGHEVKLTDSHEDRFGIGRTAE